MFLCGRHMDEMWYWRMSKTQISRVLGKYMERGIKKYEVVLKPKASVPAEKNTTHLYLQSLRWGCSFFSSGNTGVHPFREIKMQKKNLHL